MAETIDKQIDMSLDDLIKSKKGGKPAGKPQGKFVKGKMMRNRRPASAQGPKTQRTQRFTKKPQSAPTRRLPGQRGKLSQALNAKRTPVAKRGQTQAKFTQNRPQQNRNFNRTKPQGQMRTNKPQGQMRTNVQNGNRRQRFNKPQQFQKRFQPRTRQAPVQVQAIPMSKGLRNLAAGQGFQAPRPMQVNRGVPRNFQPQPIPQFPKISRPALPPGHKFVLPQGTEMKISFATGQNQMMQAPIMPVAQPIRFNGNQNQMRRGGYQNRPMSGRGGSSIVIS